MPRPTPIGFHEIDIRALKREGLLEPGRSGAVRQSIGGRVVRTASVVAHPDEIEITVAGRQTFASMTTTAQHFGGRRTWFLCPNCSGRAAILYGPSFACRTCHRIAYPSQRETHRLRMLRRAQDLRIRIGGSTNMLEPIPARPWGMHQLTYRRIRDQVQEIDGRLWAASAPLVARLERRLAGRAAR